MWALGPEAPWEEVDMSFLVIVEQRYRGREEGVPNTRASNSAPVRTADINTTAYK